MISSLTGNQSFFFSSSIYKEFLEERNEILKHKWIESEKKGYDIGYDCALIDWIMKYRTNFRKHRFKKITYE